MSVLKVVQRPIDEIKPYEKNPRLNDQAVEAVAASIRQFGFRQPIVVDEAGVIVCGHTRYKAA
ncbi:MAG: chromosome partitioning protein ParB, partial [Bacteroidetes bacterium]